MSAPVSLRRFIESCELPHLFFVSLEGALSRRADDALAGYAPTCVRVVGPSRAGKSMLIRALARRYPERRVDNGRHLPVVVVDVPSPVTPKEMPRSVLSAYGMPSVRGNSGDLFERLRNLVRLAGTRVLLFEEASHIVEVGTKLPSRAAGDWFKSVMDRLEVSIMLFGVPRLEKLFQSNEQLRNRSKACHVFRPYDYTVAEERAAFAACVKTYMQRFEEAGWPFAIPLDVLAPHCYLASGGLIGVVSALMGQLAFDLEGTPPHPISFQECALAVSRIEAAGDPLCPAFQRQEVTAVELRQAYVAVLLEAGLPTTSK